MTGKGDASTPSLELPRPANTEPAHPDDHDPRTPLMDTITATPLDHHDTPLTAHLSEQPHNTASTQPSEPRTIPSVKRVSKPVGFKDLDDVELKAPTPLKFSSNQQTPEDFDIFTNDDDSRSVDTFGLPAYVQRYLVERGTDVPEGLSVPWNLRDGDRQQKCTTFDCLRSANFWKQFEFSMRMTVIAVLVLSSIIAARVHNTPFISVYASISSTVLAAKTSVGESIAYIFTWARAGCCWLPLACIAGATRMSNNMVAWSLYYTIILFFMATYTEAMVRRICLLLFNSCMVGLLMFPTYGAVYPCRVMVDWCIGTGLCFLAILIPYPIFCFKAAQRSIDDIAKNTGTAFRGLVYSFWSPTNVERNMAMTKVRHMTESLDHLLPELEHSQSFSFYEFLFEPTEHREVRRLKQAFFERLRVNLSSMTRVLDMVEANPGAIDDSDRSKAFGLSLTPLLDDVASSFDDLLLCLSQAKTLKAIGALQKKFDAFKDRTDTLRMMYKSSRKRLFYEHASDTLEEFVPLMTFYIFTVECFYDTLEVFELDLKTYSKSPTRWSSVLPVVKRVVVQPFLDNVEFTRVLVTEWDRREVQRVIEAAKVSGAMILTIGFSFLIKIDKASFSGPNIIAFVAGSNPVEAVQASIVRLTGCLIGTVLGFFAGTYSNTPVQRVASLCTLMFIGTFLRNDKEYGIMAIYAMFVLIPLDTIMGVTLTTAVERMNQNTFGIFIYLLVSILIFPLSPATILRAKRRNVLKHMSDVVSRLMNLFSTPLASGIVQDGVDAKSHPILSNRSMHSVLHTDSAMEDLGRSLEEVTRRLKGTKEFMGFAKEERGLVEVDYPVKSCEQTYTHMHRMTVLLKTMEMSWNVIRSQSVYYKETQRMMQSLLPIAFDVSRSFARFVDLITYMMDDPATNLESDIMSTVLDLISASHELHSRKTQIMLMVINRALTNYRPQSKSTSADDGAAAHGSPDSSSPHPSQLKYRHTSAETIPNTYLPHRGSGYSQPLDLNFHENNVYLRQESQPHMSEHSGFRVSQSKRNVSVLPYLRHRGCVSTDECGESMPLKLPEDFELPVSSEDAEGFHSFTLCMDMFAEETKQLMMSLGIMLAQLRSKM